MILYEINLYNKNNEVVCNFSVDPSWYLICELIFRLNGSAYVDAICLAKNSEASFYIERYTN